MATTTLNLKPRGVYTVNLVEGQNIRDHNNDGYNNTTGNISIFSYPIYTFTFENVRLDEQAFILPAAFNSATLTDIILIGTGNNPNGAPFLAAATVRVSAVPEPTSLMMLGIGATGVLIYARRCKPRAAANIA